MATVFYPPPPPSLYEVLRIPVGATNKEIKSAYRPLALTFHPDVRRETDAGGNEFIRIHAAYSTLSDPDKRAVYERTMFAARGIHRPLTSLNSSGSGEYGSRRRWETDQCW